MQAPRVLSSRMAVPLVATAASAAVLRCSNCCEMDEEISRLILLRAEAREVQHAAMDAGMRTMFADGIAKAQAGLTTVEEILRVTREA